MFDFFKKLFSTGSDQVQQDAANELPTAIAENPEGSMGAAEAPNKIDAVRRRMSKPPQLHS